MSGSSGLEVLRRLRPVPDRSVDGGPSPSTHAGSVGSGKDRNGSRVHLHLARRRRSPTLSLRHRHGYPAALHRGLPREHPHAHPRVPHPTSPGWVRTAPAHIHQIGAGEPLRDVLTLVPRVLLFVTLAEPTPSGSTGVSRLVRAAPTDPGTSRDRLPSASSATARSWPGASYRRLSAHPPRRDLPRKAQRRRSWLAVHSSVGSAAARVNERPGA